MKFKLILTAVDNENKVKVNGVVSEETARKIINLAILEGIKEMTPRQLKEVLKSLEEQIKAD